MSMPFEFTDPLVTTYNTCISLACHMPVMPQYSLYFNRRCRAPIPSSGHRGCRNAKHCMQSISLKDGDSHLNLVSLTGRFLRNRF